MEFNRYHNVAKQLKQVADVEDKDARREALRQLLRENNQVAILVQYAYHPAIVFDLPDTPIPDSEWTPSKVPNHNGLYREIRSLQYLTTRTELKQLRRMQIYAQILNILEPEDVILLKAVVQKKLPWKTLNNLFVTRAVPELFPQETQAATDK